VQARIHRRRDRRECLSEKGSSGATATSTIPYLSARAAKGGRRLCLNVNYAVSMFLVHNYIGADTIRVLISDIAPLGVSTPRDVAEKPVSAATRL
jgi:hypothetical protein